MTNPGKARDRDGGAWIHHVEEIEMPPPFKLLWDLAVRRWFARSVREEVAEISRLMAAGERGRGFAAHGG